MKLWLFLFLMIITTAVAVLSPEHQRTLYCPSKTCIKRKNVTIFGPRRSNYECVDARGDTTNPIAPHPGRKIIIDRLLDGGFHNTFCKHLRGMNAL